MTSIKAIIKPEPRIIATVQKVAVSPHSTTKPPEFVVPDLLTIYQLSKI